MWCVENIPTALMDMPLGLMDWSEYEHFGYEFQPVERSSLLMYEDINGGAGAMKNPASE